MNKANTAQAGRTITCSECGAQMPDDTYARAFGRCARHADEEREDRRRRAEEYEHLGNMSEWEDGMNACLGGMTRHANPHTKGDQEWAAWDLGWKEAQEEMEQVNGADV